jgi:hypothetical protein
MTQKGQFEPAGLGKLIEKQFTRVAIAYQGHISKVPSVRSFFLIPSIKT